MLKVVVDITSSGFISDIKCSPYKETNWFAKEDISSNTGFRLIPSSP